MCVCVCAYVFCVCVASFPGFSPALCRIPKLHGEEPGHEAMYVIHACFAVRGPYLIHVLWVAQVRMQS